MWWIVVIIIAVMLFSRLDDIIELYKSKSPHYQKEREKQQLEHDQERSEIIQQLKASINSECQIESNSLIYMSNSYNKLNAIVVNVDNDWVELLTNKKRKKIKLFLKIDHISSVSKIL